LASCEQSTAPVPLHYSSVPAVQSVPHYRLVPHPLYTPKRLADAFQPLVDYLNRQIPKAFIELESSRDYPAYEKKFRAREGDILMPNP
jgi:phosphonate transport system substrate-binding protein